jgi:hypothetical protein
MTGLGRCYVCGTPLDGYDLGQCPHCDRPCWLGSRYCDICIRLDHHHDGTGPGSTVHQRRHQQKP